MKNSGAGRVVKRGRTYYAEAWHHGERVRKSSGSTRRKDAVDLLKKLNGESAQGRIVSPSAERLTLADLLDMVKADHALNGRKSAPPVKKLVEHLGKYAKALDLTHDTLTSYARARIVEGAAHATVRNELAVLGRGFALAHRSGKLTHRPALPTIRVQNARTGFFEPSDLAAVLPHLPTYLRPFVEVAYLTGWRRGELVNLRWKQVDWNAGEMRLERGTTKSGEPRTFPFTALPRLAEILQEQRERVASIERERGFLIPWVFVHDDGRQMRGWYYDAWKAACERTGLSGRLVHDFRRSAARNLVRAGVPEGVAMKLTGHATRSIFDRYNVTSGTDLREAVEKLARFHVRPSEDLRMGRVVAISTKERSA